MNEPCCICLEDINAPPKQAVITLNCNHHLHNACFTQYVVFHIDEESDLRCPLCRSMMVDYANQAAVFYIYFTAKNGINPVLFIVTIFGLFIVFMGVLAWMDVDDY